MKLVFKIMSIPLFLVSIYGIWANGKWEPLDNQTGIMENCRWKTNENTKVYDCLIRLSSGELAGVHNFILDDESHSNVTVKVESNKLRKKRKRYTYIGSN